MPATLLNRLLTVSPDAVLIVDEQARIEAANEAAGTLLAQPVSRLRGRSLLEVTEDDDERVLRFLRRCSGSGSSLPGALTLRTPQGSKPVTAYGAAVRVDGSMRIALHCTEAHRASSVFRELEERLQALHQELHRERRLQLELQEALRERDVLLSEVHHRVRNNLQVVSSLLSLQMRENISDEVQAVLRSTQARIQALALVHNQLYAQKTLDRIDLSLLLPSICERLAGTYQVRDRIGFSTSLSPWLVDVATASSLALLVTEAVTNAIRHAFPDGRAGTIRLEMPAAGRPRRLRIADDGVGMGSRAGAVGSRLMEALAAHLKAQLEIHTDHGVELLLDLPEEPARLAPV